MKTKLNKTIAVTLCAVAFVFAGFVVVKITSSHGVDYTNPAPGHFVTPLASGITWGPVTTLKAFYPAQANLQWLAAVPSYTHPVGGTGSMQTHPGASSVSGGTLNCKSCHATGLANGTFATNLVNTPAGITGKVPYKQIDIQSAFDSTYLYIKASWQTQRPRPGITHQAYRYIDGVWTDFTKDKNSQQNTVAQLGTNEYYSKEDRMMVMLVPTTVGSQLKAFGNQGVSFNEAGCFIACHSSMDDMPQEPTLTTIQADPWLGTTGLNAAQVRHYLLQTRAVSAFTDANASGNWQTNTSGYNLAQRTADFQNGKFLNLWVLRGARSAPMYQATSNSVLEFRHDGLANTNQGANPWFDQNPATAQPANWNQLWYDAAVHQWKDAANAVVSVASYRWMYDSLRTGFHAFPANAVNTTAGELSYAWTVKYPLITRGPDRNAVPFNINKINVGDILPRNVHREATGIRGSLNTFSKWDSTSGKWTVTFRRKLNTAVAGDHGAYGTWSSDHKITVADLLSSGQGLTVAFGVMDDHTIDRFHHITFGYTLKQSGADINAYYNTPTGINAPMENPTSHSLAQNYPNPFNPATKIFFSLTKESPVSLQVYDMMGRVVATLVNEEVLPAGNHAVVWNGRTSEGRLAASGIYFYRLKAEGYVATRKMTLLK